MPKFPLAFKKELIVRASKEQSLRQLWEKDLQNERIREKVRAIDAQNTTFLKRIVSKYGWPKISEVGKKAAESAWLMLQHSPEIKFMSECLKLMEAMPNEIEPANLARTIDRVRILEGRLQYYGTHFKKRNSGKYEAIPIEDKDHVEERRKIMNLPPIEEQLRDLNQDVPVD